MERAVWCILGSQLNMRGGGGGALVGEEGGVTGGSVRPSTRRKGLLCYQEEKRKERRTPSPLLFGFDRGQRGKNTKRDLKGAYERSQTETGVVGAQPAAQRREKG